MKILQRIGVGFVCLSLVFTFGCNSPKKATASTSNLKTTTATKQNSVSPSQATGTTATGTTATGTTATGTIPVATLGITSKPSRTGPFDGGYASDQPLVYNLFSADNAEVFLSNGRVPIELSDPEMTVGGQFFATTSFNYIETACPSWSNNIGNLTLSIYNWNNDYAATVAGKAIKSMEFVNYSDCTWLKLLFEAPLPSGEYLWVLSNPVEQVGIYDIPTGPDKHESDVKSYISGEVTDTYHIVRIEYTKTPNITLIPLS